MPLNLPAASPVPPPPAPPAPAPSASTPSPHTRVVGGGSEAGGAPKKHTTKKLWSAKKYKKEYDKSVREMKRTKKRFMNYLKRII
jgi:hypothetical protein